jgi:predicted PurR-regulated permease PerM
LFVMAPIAFLGVVFARQAANIVSAMSNSNLTYPDLLARLDKLPFIGGAVRWIRETTPVSADDVKGWVMDGAQSVLKSAASMSGSIALNIMGSLVGFFMMLFLLFFLLRDGRAMLRRLTGFIPMEPRPRGQLMAYLGEMTKAVVFGSVATALIQGALAGVGFALAGLPSPVVFGVLATLAAFLPVGSAVVLVPAVLYLMFQGHWGAAIFLAAWSAGVGVIDNILRPFLTATQVEVSTLAVFVGAIGGASAFGILGLVIGPVLLGFISALLQFAEKGVVGGE